jgi:hypothetical protein
MLADGGEGERRRPGACEFLEQAAAIAELQVTGVVARDSEHVEGRK